MQILLFIFGISFSHAGDDYYSKCNDESKGYVSFANRPECLPDTLYSWQPYHSIDWRSFDTTPPVGKYLYTWRTPIGTFGYGNTQIRMKVTPGTKFKVILDSNRDCVRLLRDSDEGKTIFVALMNFRAGKIITDFLICTPDVIESWSAHTEESYQEALREADYIWDHYFDAPQTYDSYLTYDHRWNFNKITNPNREKFPFGTMINDEGNDWRKKTFIKRLHGLRKQSNKWMGKVYGTNPDQHFKTNVKLYY